MPWLLQRYIRSNDQKGKILVDQYWFRAGQTTIGRKGSDIIINDPSVSRKHSIFRVESSGSEQLVYVKDVSKFGTFVGRTKIGKNEEVALEDGALLRFGVCKNIFRLRWHKLVVFCAPPSRKEHSPMHAKLEHVFLPKKAFATLKTISKSEGWTLTDDIAQCAFKEQATTMSPIRGVPNCVSISSSEAKATPHHLLSITSGMPIVSLSWAEAMANRAISDPWPPVSEFPPPCDLPTNIDLESVWKLFKGVTFVFLMGNMEKKNLTSTKKEYEMLVEGAGGTVVSGPSVQQKTKKDLDSFVTSNVNNVIVYEQEAETSQVADEFKRQGVQLTPPDTICQSLLSLDTSLLFILPQKEKPQSGPKQLHKAARLEPATKDAKNPKAAKQATQQSQKHTSQEKWKRMSVRLLKEELRKRHLPVSGRKAALIQRLVQDASANNDHPLPSEAPSRAITAQPEGDPEQDSRKESNSEQTNQGQQRATKKTSPTKKPKEPVPHTQEQRHPRSPVQAEHESDHETAPPPKRRRKKAANRHTSNDKEVDLPLEDHTRTEHSKKRNSPHGAPEPAGMVEAPTLLVSKKPAKTSNFKKFRKSRAPAHQQRKVIPCVQETLMPNTHAMKMWLDEADKEEKERLRAEAEAEELFHMK